VRALQPSLNDSDVRDLADRLPLRRAFPRAVPLTGDELAAPDRADARTREGDTRRMSERAAQIVRETIAALPADERMLVRLRYGGGTSIADAARILGVPQRPLYRRIEALLRQLRTALERGGAGAAVIEDVIAAGASDGFDFGLGQRKNDSGRHTVSGDGA
jgi:DNA-directed RNA polymerase specialized sigma24 family protein